MGVFAQTCSFKANHDIKLLLFICARLVFLVFILEDVSLSLTLHISVLMFPCYFMT